MTPPLVLIAAVGRNGAIGRRNGLPWRLAGDMRHFRDRTMGKPLILGRKTFQSIGRPLPGRSLVVVSADPSFRVPPDTVLCRDLEAAVEEARGIAELRGAEAVMVGGGAAVYAALIDRADRIEITDVHLSPEADATFPAIDPARWQEVSREPQAREPEDDGVFAFVTYERR